MKQRKCLCNQAERSNKHEDWAAYQSARNEVNKVESAHSSYCRRMFDNSFSGNHRQFWKYIKAKHKDSTEISPLLVNGSTVSNPQGKAAVLSDQFQLVFTIEDTSNVSKLDDNSFITSMPAISFSTSGIQTLL